MNGKSNTLVESDIERELRLAHQIIKNALGVMTPMQKLQWGLVNDRHGCGGEGITRANERERVLSIAAEARK